MSNPADPNDGLPPPSLRPWAGLPWIWAVPVIALLIAAWLGIRSVADRGPVITISFANAEGIEIGRNEAARATIRYKNVELGRVTGIGLSPDKMLMGRIFSYHDTHLHRIGPKSLVTGTTTARATIATMKRSAISVDGDAAPARFGRRIRSRGQPPDPVKPSTCEEV